jgi:hypothetical protein
MAKQKAEALLRDEGITNLPVDPFAIAASRAIEVKAKPDTAEGVSGMLLRHGDVFGILYATHIPSEGFQRFSIGHELGHYFLEGHIDHILPEDGVHESHAGFVMPWRSSSVPARSLISAFCLTPSSHCRSLRGCEREHWFHGIPRPPNSMRILRVSPTLTAPTRRSTSWIG